MGISFKTLAFVLLSSASALASAANDGQARASQLLNADPQFRETWQKVVQRKSDCPSGS